MDEQGQPEPLSRLSFFIPMRDVTPENGSTEIWVGSHNDLCWVPGQKLREKNPNPGQPDAETQEAARGRLPPTQVSLPKGAVLLRDDRHVLPLCRHEQRTRNTRWWPHLDRRHRERLRDSGERNFRIGVDCLLQFFFRQHIGRPSDRSDE